MSGDVGRQTDRQGGRHKDRQTQTRRHAGWLAVWPADTHTKGWQIQTGGSEPSRFITEIDTEQRAKAGRNEPK